MEDLVRAVVSSLRYELYDRIKEQLNLQLFLLSFEQYGIIPVSIWPSQFK